MPLKHYHIAQVTMPGGVIPQMSEQSLDPQTQEYVESYDGQVDPSFAAILMQKPMMRLSSTALAAVLTSVGIGGLAYGGVSDPVAFYYQPAAYGGTRDTTDCTRFVSEQGMVVLDGIEAAEGQPATASLMAYCNSADGESLPMAMTSGVTLPTPVTAKNVHTVGPVKINGVLISGVIGSSLRFGLQVTHECADGSAYPTMAYILVRRAVATVRTRNVELVESLGLFTPQSASQKSTLFYRKMLPGGTRVPNATAAHVSLGISAGMILARRVDAQQGQPATAEIEIPIIYNGVDAPVIVNTATVIA